jgi:hypothetical protein
MTGWERENPELSAETGAQASGERTGDAKPASVMGRIWDFFRESF